MLQCPDFCRHLRTCLKYFASQVALKSVLLLSFFQTISVSECQEQIPSTVLFSLRTGYPFTSKLSTGFMYLQSIQIQAWLPAITAALCPTFPDWISLRCTHVGFGSGPWYMGHREIHICGYKWTAYMVHIFVCLLQVSCSPYTPHGL